MHTEGMRKLSLLIDKFAYVRIEPLKVVSSLEATGLKLVIFRSM